MSSSDNNNDKVQIVIPSAAQERARWRQERLMSEFGKLLHSSLTIDQICDHFQISRRTYYIWIRKLARTERKFMQRNFRDVMLNELAGTVSELKHLILTMNSLLSSKEVEPADKIEASKVAAELQLALLKVYKEGSATVWGEMPPPLKKLINEQMRALPVKIEITDDGSKQQEQPAEKEKDGPGQGQQ
jgi:hypothetical protein